MRCKNIIKTLLDILFPQVCGICGKLSGNSLCKKCEILLKKQSKFEIYENDSLENYFDEHLYFFKYDGIIRKVILNYKFKDKAYLYKTISNFLIKNKEFCEKVKSYDIIMPVPISKKRFKERGYNQSLLIAKHIAQNLKINLENNCLYKHKNIIEQSKLNKEERAENIKGVYSIKNEEKIKNKKILLIDDIYTTGSTVNECCKMLIKANSNKIGVLTIAKD